jgi:hypothetical protein
LARSLQRTFLEISDQISGESAWKPRIRVGLRVLTESLEQEIGIISNSNRYPSVMCEFGMRIAASIDVLAVPQQIPCIPLGLLVISPDALE